MEIPSLAGVSKEAALGADPLGEGPQACCMQVYVFVFMYVFINVCIYVRICFHVIFVYFYVYASFMTGIKRELRAAGVDGVS